MYLLFTTIVRAIHCTPVAHNGGLRMMISILTQGFFLFFAFSIRCVLRHLYPDADQGFMGIFRGPFHFQCNTILSPVRAKMEGK